MRKIILSPILSLLLIGGTTAISAYPQTGSEHHYLRAPLPENWGVAEANAQTLPADDTWWSGFGDSTLDSLIALGESNNFDLAMAARRADEALQGVRSASAAYFPAVGATAGWQRSRTDGIIAGGYSLGLHASWEPDIFGKVRARVKQSGHNYDASRAEYTAAMVSMCAQIASAYFDLRTAQAQREVANEHIGRQQHIVDIAKARHEAGLASALDVAQALTVLYTTQSSLPLLDTQIGARPSNTVHESVGATDHVSEPSLKRPSG